MMSVNLNNASSMYSWAHANLFTLLPSCINCTLLMKYRLVPTLLVPFSYCMVKVLWKTFFDTYGMCALACRDKTEQEEDGDMA